jgi:hypothetical protein
VRGSVSVSRARVFLQAGTHRVSQVPDASLPASHALRWTPADPRAAHQKKRCLCVGFWGVNTIAICIKRLYEAVSSFGECGLPCGLRGSLCTLQLLCSALHRASSTVATLGMSGWLDLAQPGLPPGKKRQASLGALTPPLTSRPDAPFHVQQSRHRAAMRCSGGLGRDLLIGKMGNVCMFTCMLDREAANVAVLI